MFTWHKKKSKNRRKIMLEKHGELNWMHKYVNKKDRSLPASMHQWILQGNGQITLELERGRVSLSPKEIILNRKKSLKVGLLEFL